jgi:hypothetical protein
LGGKVRLDGFLGGHGVHFVEFMLCDPFLMRLPLWDSDDWQAGNFMRSTPDGYLWSLVLGKKMIRHPGLAMGDDGLRLVLREELLDAKFLQATWSLDLVRRGLGSLQEIPTVSRKL